MSAALSAAVSAPAMRPQIGDVQALARRLDLQADLLFNQGCRVQAERLSTMAQEIREAAR